MTICRQWAWKPNDKMKPLDECIRTLVSCVGGNGNLLFNVGPMPDGRIEPRQVERLKEMGAWLEKYGESIYGTRGGPVKPGRGFVTTRKGNAVYLHVFAGAPDEIVLPALPRKVRSATILDGGPVEVDLREASWVVSLPPTDRHPIDTVVKITLKVRSDGEWKTVAVGKKLGSFRIDFDPVEASALRLEISRANERPTISELRVRR